MAVSDSAKVDLLFKKYFGATKTDLPANKSPSNEAIASPLLVRGDTVWQQATSIPPTAAATTGIVQAYQGTGRIQCTADNTTVPISSVYPSWKTGLTDWIPSEFGSTYFVKVYVDNSGASDPSSTGTQIFDSGSGGTGEWNFDYSAGVLNFIGGTIPAVLTSSKVIYVMGYRYIGYKGVTSYPGGMTIGNITIAGNTITGNNNVSFGGNITAGNIVTTAGTVLNNGLTTTGNVVAGNVVATQFNGNVFGTLTGNASGTTASYTSLTGTISTSYQPNITGVGTLANLSVSGNIVAGNVISNFYGNVHSDYIYANVGQIVTIGTTGALKLPIGSTAQQPAGANGLIRFNSDSNTVEYWSGTAWVALTNTVTDQQITGDGTNITYTLDQTATNVGVLVSINGTLQAPGVAYTVSGDQITFAEAPLNTDIIDVRFLGGIVTMNNTLSDDLTISGNLTISGLLTAPQVTKASNAIGTVGQMCWDANYIYVCTATNTWKRSPLTGGY